jgi:lipopolysaccharide transport system ATP-binding protein
MVLIEFDNVTKWFPHTAGRQLLRGHVSHWFRRKRQENFQALKRVSFRIEQGESLAVVGENGAGKSTLLSLAARLTTPNSGRVTVNGRVAPLLQLGAGFHGDLTGAENLLLNAALLGLGRKRAMEQFDRIVEYSGIGDFINDPLRTYSSGMVMRLGFSVAIHTQPEILLIDEVLAVGDANFQQKCLETLRELRREGKSMLFVSHSAASVRLMCDRAIWLDHGELIMDGDVEQVLEAYSGGAALRKQPDYSSTD